jgi:DNA invertase Pin-like site-specific DNA recombinase
MMAAFAELERDIIYERGGRPGSRPGSGQVGGRPAVMDPDKLAAARARWARGESPAQIAKALGVSRASVYRHLEVRPGRPRPGRGSEHSPACAGVRTVR